MSSVKCYSIWCSRIATGPAGSQECWWFEICWRNRHRSCSCRECVSFYSEPLSSVERRPIKCTDEDDLGLSRSDGITASDMQTAGNPEQGGERSSLNNCYLQWGLKNNCGPFSASTWSPNSIVVMPHQHTDALTVLCLYDGHRAPCFGVFNHNAGGINSRDKDFLIHGPLIDEDGIAITQTWLSGQRFSAESFDADMFAMFRQDRIDRRKKRRGCWSSRSALNRLWLM